MLSRDLFFSHNNNCNILIDNYNCNLNLACKLVMIVLMRDQTPSGLTRIGFQTMLSLVEAQNPRLLIHMRSSHERVQLLMMWLLDEERHWHSLQIILYTLRYLSIVHVIDFAYSLIAFSRLIYFTIESLISFMEFCFINFLKCFLTLLTYLIKASLVDT